MTSVLVAAVGKSLFAVDVQQVSHVVWRSRVTPLPGSPACVAGVLVHRQHLIGVVNLEKRMKRKSDGSRRHVFLVRQGELMFGLQVDRVLGVVSTEESLDAQAERVTIPGGEAVLVRPEQLLTGKEDRVFRGIY